MTINYVTLPLFSDPYYSYSIALEGTSYILQFLYNDRMKLYTFSLFTADNIPIVRGEALVPSYPLFKDYAIDGLTGWFSLEQKEIINSEPYKNFPEKINQYYNFFYIYVTED